MNFKHILATIQPKNLKLFTISSEQCEATFSWGASCPSPIPATPLTTQLLEPPELLTLFEYYGKIYRNINHVASYMAH